MIWKVALMTNSTVIEGKEKKGQLLFFFYLMLVSFVCPLSSGNKVLLVGCCLLACLFP